MEFVIVEKNIHIFYSIKLSTRMNASKEAQHLKIKFPLLLLFLWIFKHFSIGSPLSIHLNMEFDGERENLEFSNS